MSKNGQMRSFSHPSVGPASIVQGVYGERGNLELVVADARDGLWVHWLNADPTAVGDVLPGDWSAGLRFATGQRYVAAQILQDTLGPNFLEVLALRADGVLESWYWSPGPGFQQRQPDAATAVTQFHASLTPDGTLTIALDGDRAVESAPDGHPNRTWHPAPAIGLPGPADEQLTAAGVDPSTVAPGTARAATSTRGLELTWRDTSGSLLHRRVE